MIIRVVRGRVRKSAEAEFHSRVHASLPVVRAVPGLIDVRVGRQRDADTEQFVFVSQWRDLESLYGWVGRNDLLCVPAVPAGYEDLLDECDVQHYEDFEPEAEPPE